MRILMAEYFCSCSVLNIIDTALPSALFDMFKFGPEKAAVYLAFLMGVRPFISLLLVQIPESLNKRYILIPASFLGFIGSCLTGPSTIIFLPQKPELIIAGLILLGLSGSLIISMTYSWAFAIAIK